MFAGCTYGLQGEITCLRGFANNKCADKPEHLVRLISAFVICFLDSIVSIFLQVKCQFLASLCSVRDWLEPRFVGNPEDRFCHVGAPYHFVDFPCTSSINNKGVHQGYIMTMVLFGL